MPRTMWKGAISFGLVSIPIRVFPATEEKTLRFNQLHAKDGGRIKYQRVCSIDGEEVPYDEIVKGYEIEKDRYVMLDDEDFDKVPVESSRAIDIQEFVDISEIDPIYFKKTYYLVPDETGVKAYTLLREAMSDSSKVGIAKVSFRDKEQLAALRFKDEVFVLETMFWPDEIREAGFEELQQPVKLRPQEVQMAQALIESLSGEWSPEEFTDEYREALMKIVEAKASGEEIVAAEPAEEAKVVDLMEALKASVEAAKKPRSSSGAATKTTAKSSKSSKSSAKKTAAKKTTAKTAARKAG
jgi:DNA end-binding protein Ku